MKINALDDIDGPISSVDNNGAYIFEDYYKTIRNIEAGTTIEEFKSKFDDYYNIRIYQLEEELCEGIIKYGMTISVEINNSINQYQVIEDDIWNQLNSDNQSRTLTSTTIFTPRTTSAGMSGNPY